MTDVGSASDVASLLPPNATALERAVEILSRRIDAIPTPLRDLADADTCPARFLPWLAFTRSVDSWNPAWPEAVKRALIAASITSHRQKGTAAAVRAVAEAFGGQIALREWWETTPRGDPHTFQIVMTLDGAGSEPASAEYFEEVIAQIARTKPARSWFSATQGLMAAGGVAIGAAARAVVAARLQLTALVPSPPPGEGQLDFQNPANSALIGLF